MEYQIQLEGMSFHAYHGCYEQERLVGGLFEVELRLLVDLGHTAQEDDLSKAVNYQQVYEVVEEQMKVTQHTLERATMNIIEALRKAFPQIRKVRCKLSKMAPPLGGKVERASVTIEW